MPIPQHYPSISILLCFILFFGITKCDNVYCSSYQDCQSSQYWYPYNAGQTRSYEFTLSGGKQLVLDIDVSKNEQDWSITVGSADLFTAITASVLVDGQTKISPATGLLLGGRLYLSQTSNSRYVRFIIKNTNSSPSSSAQIDLELAVTRFISYKYSSGTKVPYGIIIIAAVGAIGVLIIIGVTIFCIRRRKRLALQRRLQAANRSALDPIVNNTQLNNSSFQQQNMSYMQDNSFTLQQYGQPVNPQLEFAQPVPQYNQFIQPQLQPQPQIYELQPAPQMYMPAYPQPQPQVQVQVQPQQIMIHPAT